MFRYEREMGSAAEAWLRSQGLLVKREFSVPWGRCDFVGCALHKLRARRRLRLKQRTAIGHIERVALLSRIPAAERRKSISRQALYRLMGDLIDEQEINRELLRLHQGHFVRFTRRGNLQRINGWVPLHRRLVALELKLERIEDALRQARDNTEFADESYVGLPLDVAYQVARGRKKQAFTDTGIGILGVSREQCRVILKARRQTAQPDNPIQVHCTERFWQDWLTTRGTEA